MKNERLRDVQRLRRELHLRMNFKEGTTQAATVSDRILARACGHVICKYPEWLERKWLGFRLWRGQYRDLKVNNPLGINTKGHI